MNKQWCFKPSQDTAKIKELMEALNVSKATATLLLQRGIDTFEKAKNFFRPSLTRLHDPFLMQDMQKAVDRVEQAISNSEKILIYGDYDVDGTTAVALFYSGLIKLYPNISFYIPDRYEEGYGISFKGIDFAKENDFKLIVTLDCGIKAFDKADYANERNIDIIICDHHRPDEILPKAYAVLDPKRQDCQYPFKELSGCGVGFKLLQAIYSKRQLSLEPLFEHLDLLAVSIAADIVPIVDENRIFAYFGLRKLNTTPCFGLAELKNLTQYDRDFDISSIVFGIAPRINAAGRIKHAKHAVELLLAKSAQEATDLAQIINAQNEERKDFDTNTTEEAISQIEEFVDKDAYSTVLYKPDWHKGVIGIVASRCIEKFYRPTIILTESNGKVTGSARSVHGFDIYEAILQCSDLLEQFGGHMYAAGLTLEKKNVEAFKKKFEEVVKNSITPEQRIPRVDVDLVLDFDEINDNFFKVMNEMAPFGPENMSPIFVSKKLLDNGWSRLLKGMHVKIYATQLENANLFTAIGFNMKENYEIIKSGKPFDLCYSIYQNTYKGNNKLELLIKDIKLSSQ